MHELVLKYFLPVESNFEEDLFNGLDSDFSLLPLLGNSFLSYNGFQIDEPTLQIVMLRRTLGANRLRYLCLVSVVTILFFDWLYLAVGSSVAHI